MTIKRSVCLGLIALATVTICLFLLKPKTASAGQDAISLTPKIPYIMQKIAYCESHDRQFNADGSLHRGDINPSDIGYFQVNEVYWAKKAKSLGFDIYTLKGNTAMALWIYTNYGTTPWNWSKACWNKNIVVQ
jgi:hypothetical protein